MVLFFAGFFIPAQRSIIICPGTPRRKMSQRPFAAKERKILRRTVHIRMLIIR